MSEKKLLVFVEEGLGNIIQAIPSLIAMNKVGYTIDIALRANYAGIKEILRIPEINNIYNVYVEQIPNPKQYEKIVLTMFGHVDHYRFWKEDFEGIEVMQDLELNREIGTKNDVEINMRYAYALGYEGEIPDIKINYPDNNTFQYFDNIICPGAGAWNKIWPYYAEFAKKLTGRVGIIGGPKEAKINWPPNCVDMSGLLSLTEIAAIISKAGIFIGNDGGLTHLANATGCPCVVIWGPTNLTKCKPWNNPVAIVSKEYSCQPCILIQTSTKCEKEHKNIECLRDVSINEVLEAVDDLLNNCEYKSDLHYTKYWDRETKIHSEVDFSKDLNKLLKELDLKGETCIDYGCGDGRYLATLNHFYKNITAVDIVEQKIPKLNNIVFKKVKPFLENNEIEKCDTILISDTLSYMNYKDMMNHNLEKLKDKFKNVIIIDRVFGKENIKHKNIDIKEIGKVLDIELEDKLSLQSGEISYKIFIGRK